MARGEPMPEHNTSMGKIGHRSPIAILNTLEFTQPFEQPDSMQITLSLLLFDDGVCVCVSRARR